jgi:hydrophobe/amphiphile efflux-3 (HAE3) family protein
MDGWARLGRWLARRSGVVLGTVVALTVLLALGLPRLTFATGQDSYLNADTEVYTDNIEYQNLFGGQAMLTLFTAEDGRTVADLFTPENNAAMRALAERIKTNDGVAGVITPLTALEFTNNLVTPQTPGDPLSSVAASLLLGAQETAATSGDAASADVRLADAAKTLERLSAVPEQERTVDNPVWAEFLLTDSAGMIRPALRPFFPPPPGGEPTLENARNAQMITRLAGNASIEAEGSAATAVQEATAATSIEGFTLLATGAPVLLKDINDYLRGGMLTLGGIALVVMLVVLAATFRVRTRLLPLLVTVIAIVWIFGLLGFVGFDLSLVTIAGLPILIGMGIDFAIQVHNRVEEELAVGSADDPFGTTARWLGPPLVVAVVAAVIAFVSMQVSEVPMVRDFGVMLAVGIVLLLVAGVVITIAVLGGRERRRPSPRHDFGDAPTERAVAWLGSLPQVTVIPLVIAAVALFGFGLVAEDAFEIESDPRRWVDQDSAVIADLETLESETGSTSELGVYIQADDVLTQPMVDFATQLGVDGLAESNGRLITASSIYMTTYLLTDVPGAAPVIPSAENVVATLAQAPPDIAKSVIADDGGAANLIFRVGPGSLADLKTLVDGIEGALVTDLTPPPGASATPSGLAVVGVGLLENVEANRALLTYVALGVVALWLLVRYRSVARMLVALVPVIMAVGTSSLVVAVAGFKLSPLTTISGPLVIATCTEFASLILARYLEERRRGLSPKEASDTASARTGKAFVTSALTTVGGFAVLMFSSLPLLRDFGAIVALNVAVALLAALVVQPPVLVWMDERGWLLKAGDRSPDNEPSPAGV